MKRTVCLIAVTCISMLFFGGKNYGQTSKRTPTAYELYSCQGSTGAWIFSLLPNTSSEKTVQEVFNNKTALRGLAPLKHRISELPAGASLHWLDRIPTGNGARAKGSEKLRYPPKEMMLDVYRFAEARDIAVFASE